MRSEAPSVFLIIGAQKAGTTALHSYLCRHPAIHSASEKELHFFNSDSRYARGLGFYHSLFPSVTSGVCLDASPSYLASPLAYKRIYDYNPKIKMIALLRDPVDRAYSAWNMYRTRYAENRNWFYEWLTYAGIDNGDFVKRDEAVLCDFERFVKSEMGHLASGESKMLESPVLMQGYYVEYLAKFFSLFPRDQLLVLESVYLREHTQEALARIQGFLEIGGYCLTGLDFTPVFKGAYRERMGRKVTRELSAFYAPRNEDLYALLGTRFDWKS